MFAQLILVCSCTTVHYILSYLFIAMPELSSLVDEVVFKCGVYLNMSAINVCLTFKRVTTDAHIYNINATLRLLNISYMLFNNVLLYCLHRPGQFEFVYII